MNLASPNRRWRALPLLAVAAFLIMVPPAAADPAATMYRPDRVDVIDLTLSPEAIDALEAEPEEYVDGTFELAETDGSPGGVDDPGPSLAVEVRLKGDASFKDLSEKAAFKLKFPNKTERPFGLKKMTLNNMVEDPSMVHETLAYTAFSAAGVPASRTSFAYVYLNGEDFGLHLNLETLDDVSLVNLFGSFDDEVQHLYEGESGADVRLGGAEDFEIDEGEDTRADLEALIAAINSSGPEPWSARVAASTDLAEMTRMWAVERYIGQRDGYTGGEAPYQPNNYYLYSDPSGRFQMLPWGTDETWQAGNHLPFDSGIGLMFDRCLGDSLCEQTYRQALSSTCGAIGAADLDSLAVSTAALLAPWQQLEQGNGARHEHNLAEIADEVAETRDFIASRPVEAADWLSAPCASVGPSPVPPASAGAPAASSSTSSAKASSRFGVGRITAVDRALSTQMHLPSSGTVAQLATISTKDGTMVACQARLEVKRARDLTLSCPLSAGVRKRLQARWLRPKLVTTFSPSSGAPEAVTRHVTLRRDRP